LDDISNDDKHWLFPPAGNLKMENLYLGMVEQVGPGSIQAKIYWKDETPP
jgi:hypothetical protein